MRHLRIFNTVKVLQGEQVTERDLQNIKYAGLCTLSQSGTNKSLIDALICASKLGITCMNVVNVEDSPVTRVIAEI